MPPTLFFLDVARPPFSCIGVTTQQKPGSCLFLLPQPETARRLPDFGCTSVIWTAQRPWEPRGWAIGGGAGVVDCAKDKLARSVSAGGLTLTLML